MTEHAQVVVVGAGPVGLAVGLGLARQGVAAVVLEAAAQPFGEGSRGALLGRDALDVLDRLGGLGRSAEAEGATWAVERTLFHGRELDRVELPATPRPQAVALPQWRTEQLLAAALAATGTADLRRGHRLEGLAPAPDGAGHLLTVANPDGTAELTADWVVACDGARSTVRRLAGIAFPGYAHDHRFLTLDLRAGLPFAGERRLWFDPPFAPGRTVMAHPLPDGAWRVDWQLPADADVISLRRSGRIGERVAALAGEAPAELLWVSSYRPSQRTVEGFRHGRVLLAGDAAHLTAPVGSSGLGGGLQDAENLAWKLGLVVGGLAPEGLLDSYDAERRRALVAERATAGEALRFVAPPGRLRRALRDAMLHTSGVRAVRQRVYRGDRSPAPDYRGSRLVLDPEPTAESFGPAPGSQAPDGPLRVVAGNAPLLAPDEATRLGDLLGPAFTVLAFPFDARASAAFLDGLARRPAAVPTVVAIVPPPGGAAAVAHLGGDGVLILDDVDGVLAERYERWGPGWFLLRPDGHVAANGLLEKGEVARIIDYCTTRADRLDLLRVGIAA